MVDINIFIIDGAELRKKLKKLMPAQVREALDQSGRDVELESAEEIREKLPAGFDKRFVVPEEVLVFPDEEEEPDGTKKRRRRMRELNTKLRRKKLPGNTEA
jgi:hypothetical protein